MGCRLSNETSRALISVRAQHLAIDSPPTLSAPNEADNPVNILLAALAGCRTFFCERAAQESGITLKSVSVTVTGNFDPRGVCGERFDPGFLGLMVRLSSDGPDGAKAQLSLQAFKSSCPVYATLARAAPVELTLA